MLGKAIVKDVKINDGEKSHCFPVGKEIQVVKVRQGLPNTVLFLCTDGNIEQYLWESEFDFV